MNLVHELFVFVQLNWRIIVLCMVVAVIVAFVMRYDRNQGRFLPVPKIPTIAIDTRTGQFCNPWPSGKGPSEWGYLRHCSDLAKSWR